MSKDGIACGSEPAERHAITLESGNPEIVVAQRGAKIVSSCFAPVEGVGVLIYGTPPALLCSDCGNRSASISDRTIQILAAGSGRDQGTEMRTAMHTISNRIVDLLNPRPEDIDLGDICYALSGIYRFTGHSRVSVAQHSVLVAGESRLEDPRARLYALLHDAHEAYMGDIATPVTNALESSSLESLSNPYNSLGGMKPVLWLKKLLQPTIHEAFGLQPEAPPDWAAAIKAADRRQCVLEALASGIKVVPPAWTPEEVAVADGVGHQYKLEPWSPMYAQRQLHEAVLGAYRQIEAESRPIALQGITL